MSVPDNPELDALLKEVELHQQLLSRRTIWIVVGIGFVGIAWEQAANPVLAAFSLTVSAGVLAMAFAARRWAHPCYFLADGVLFTVGAAYFLVLNLLGMNYWSRWFPLEWVLVALNCWFALRSYRTYGRLSAVPGARLGPILACVWCVAGCAFLAGDWLLSDAHVRHYHGEKAEGAEVQAGGKLL